MREGALTPAECLLVGIGVDFVIGPIIAQVILRRQRRRMPRSLK